MLLFFKIPISSGQLVFTGFFVVAFAVLIYFSYKKDKTVHKAHYNKAGRWTFISFLLFLAVLYLIKFTFHK